jgi:hypothetical protein
METELGPYPELDESSPYHIPLNSILLLSSIYPQGSFVVSSLQVLGPTLYVCFPFVPYRHLSNFCGLIAVTLLVKLPSM